MGFARPLVEEVSAAHSPESLAARLLNRPGVVVLRSNYFDSPRSRYSFVAADPFLQFRSHGSLCRLSTEKGEHSQFGNPWRVLDGLMARYELLDELDVPFPLGGCFGFWGYDLKNFVEPHLPLRAANDLELPDCVVGFYDSLVVFDHRLEKTWIVSSGINADGSRDSRKIRERYEFWKDQLAAPPQAPEKSEPKPNARQTSPPPVESNLSQSEFIGLVQKAREYIRAGDVYQVNLSHRLSAKIPDDGWAFYQKLASLSPAPFSAFLDCGDFQIVSSSPEQFLRLSGSHIQSRPIKGTRPRSADSDRDARLAYELQTSPKENAELVMITDLLRNDIGRVCEFGTVQVPEVVTLEKYPHVQHLVSRVEGRLRREVTHFSAFASCFPGGSITGAPKIRAMEIIDELEPVTRGPYTGSLGYLGFNRESQLNILIRTAVCRENRVWFHAGAGIVADSDPEFEYEETMDKARGFLAALALKAPRLCGEISSSTRPNLHKSGAI